MLGALAGDIIGSYYEAFPTKEIDFLLFHKDRRFTDDTVLTHDHEEGIRGAQATASAIFLARNGRDKSDIKEYIQTQFGYDLNRTLKDIRPGYSFDVSCQGSVPEAIISFLESTDYETAIRNAI